MDEPALYDDDGRGEALRAHLDLLREFDNKAQRIMAAFEDGTWEPGKWAYDEYAKPERSAA